MRRPPFAGILLAAAMGALACRGCSDVEPSGDGEPLDAGAFSPDGDARADVRTFDPPTCTPPPRPAHVPDGWHLYEGYDPCCGFYIQPPPISSLQHFSGNRAGQIPIQVILRANAS